MRVQKLRATGNLRAMIRKWFKPAALKPFGWWLVDKAAGLIVDAALVWLWLQFWQ